MRPTGLVCMYVLYPDEIASRRQIMNFIAPLVEGFPGGGGLWGPGYKKETEEPDRLLYARLGPPPNQASPSLHRRLLASSMVATWPLGCAAASPTLLVAV